MQKTIIQRSNRIRELESGLENAENNLKQADADKEEVQTKLNEALNSQFNVEIKKSEYIELGVKMGIAISSILQKIKDYFVKFNPNSIDIDDAGKIAHENIAELKNSGYEGEKRYGKLGYKR